MTKKEVISILADEFWAFYCNQYSIYEETDEEAAIRMLKKLQSLKIIGELDD